MREDRTVNGTLVSVSPAGKFNLYLSKFWNNFLRSLSLASWLCRFPLVATTWRFSLQMWSRLKGACQKTRLQMWIGNSPAPRHLRSLRLAGREPITGCANTTRDRGPEATGDYAVRLLGGGETLHKVDTRRRAIVCKVGPVDAIVRHPREASKRPHPE